MSCATTEPTKLCYNCRWYCRPGRLRRLNLQNKPSPTREYGSLGARENYIRRRTAARIRKPTAKCYNYKGEQCNQYIAYGPRFGLRKRPTVCCCPDGDPKCQHTKSSWFRSNGGSGSDVTFWKRISAGPANLMPSCLGTPRCSPSQEDQCMDCMGWYRPCPWNGRYWEGKGWNRNWERTGKPPDEAVGGQDQPAPPAFPPWSIMPTAGLTARFVDPNWPAYSATLGAPYYPTGGLPDNAGPGQNMGNWQNESWAGWQNQVTVLGGLVENPAHDSKVGATKAVESYVYYDAQDVCNRAPGSVNPPDATYLRWVKGNTGTGPAHNRETRYRTPPTGTGASLTTPRAGLAAVYIALPSQCLNCAHVPGCGQDGGDCTVTAGWGGRLPSILAIGGWNGDDGTLNSCEVIVGAAGWNSATWPGNKWPRPTPPLPTPPVVPPMHDPRCFFGAVADEKNAFPPPPEDPPWNVSEHHPAGLPSTIPPYCSSSDPVNCAWWVGAPIVTGGVSLPSWTDWDGGESKGTHKPYSSMNFAPLVWSKAWNKAVKKRPYATLKVLQKCEALVNFNHRKSPKKKAYWAPLPDMNEPRCGHAMVMTYRAVTTVPAPNAGSPAGSGKSIQVWLPNIYVIGGCQGIDLPASNGGTGGKDVLDCWPPNRKLLYSPDDVPSKQLNSVEVLSLNFPDPSPGASTRWAFCPSMNKARGGANNFSAVVMGHWIYVFGGCVPNPDESVQGGWDVERWNWYRFTEWEPVNTLLPPVVSNWGGRANTAFPWYPCGGTVVKLGQCKPYVPPHTPTGPHRYCDPTTLGICIVGSGMALAEGQSGRYGAFHARSWWEWMQFCSPGTWAGRYGDCTFDYPPHTEKGGPAYPGYPGTWPPVPGCNTCPRDNAPMLVGGTGPRPPAIAVDPNTGNVSQAGMAITPIGAFAAALCFKPADPPKPPAHPLTSNIGCHYMKKLDGQPSAALASAAAGDGWVLAPSTGAVVLGHGLAAASLEGNGSRPSTLYTLGGGVRDLVFPNVGTYITARGGMWGSVNPMLTRRTQFGAAAVEGKLLVAGGYNIWPAPSPRLLASASLFTPGAPWPSPSSEGKWASAASMNIARAGHCVVGVTNAPAIVGGGSEPRDVVYSIGGYGLPTKVPGPINAYASVEMYESNTWSSKADMTIPRYNAAAAWMGLGTQFIYVMGGRTNGPGLTHPMTDSVEVYDIIHNKWTLLKATLPSARAGAVATSFESRIYIMGGRDSAGTTLASMLIFDPSTNTWTNPAKPMITPRYMAACTFRDGIIYVMGGLVSDESAPATEAYTMEFYEPASNVGTAIGSAQANNGLYAHR